MKPTSGASNFGTQKKNLKKKLNGMIIMNKTFKNSQNGSFGGSKVENKMNKAHKALSKEEVAQIRESAAYKNAMNTVTKRANGHSELSGKKCKIERHHIRDVQHHKFVACDASNIKALSHMEHKLYHEVYNRTKSGITKDVVDTEKMWNNFVKAFKAGKLDKHMKVVEAKDARVKAIAGAVASMDIKAQEAALKDVAGIEVVKMMKGRKTQNGTSYMKFVVDEANRDRVRKAFLDNHIQIRNASKGNFMIEVND